MKPRTDPTTKPYYKCFSCPRFRKECGGIPTRGMDLKEWCEYMRDVKDLTHMTIAYITEKAEVSSRTIERILAINCDQDIMRATARRIELAIIGPVTNHTCIMDYDNTALLEEIAELRAELNRKNKIIDKMLG